jgi:hypothetical protein
LAFSNPIVAGLDLLIEAIQSPNFVSGSSGWKIAKDGTVEFNSAEIRGTITFPNENALLFYSSNPPANGTLEMSLSPVAGTDSVGNSYPAGLMFFDTIQGKQTALFSSSGGLTITDTGRGQALTLNSAYAYFSSGGTPAGTIQDSFVRALFSYLGGSTDSLVMSSALNSNTVDANLSTVALALTQSAALDGAGGVIQFLNHLGSRTLASWDKTGFNVKAGSIAAPEPGATLGTSEVWHTLTLNSPFSAGPSPFAPARYQLSALAGATQVQLSGTVTPSSGTGAFVVVGLIPYTPAFAQHYSVATKTAAGANSSVVLNVTQAGQIELGNTAAAGDVIFFDGVTVALN